MARDDYDQAAAADRLLYREESRLTVGASAFHQLDPAEIAMRLEDQDPATLAASERAALRNEIFAGAAEYLFADGPDPAEVRLRIEGFFRSYHPGLCDQIRGPHTWCPPEAVAAVLRKYHPKLAAVAADARSRGSLSTWSRQLESENDAATVTQTLTGLIEFLASEGHTWKHLVAVAYCVAKALRPSLIASMSLHDIAILSGDEGGRATPCDRIKRLYNRRLAAAGAKATQIHFQKSAAVTATYSTAQLGNHNRRRSAHKTTHPDPRKP